MLRYDRQTKPGLVALYDIRSGNGAGPSYNPGARTGLMTPKRHIFRVYAFYRNRWFAETFSCRLYM